MQQEQGYALRYTLRFRRFEDAWAARVITLVRAIDGVERVEVFVGRDV